LFCQDLGRKSVRAQCTNIILAKLHKKIIIPNSLGLFGVPQVETIGDFEIGGVQSFVGIIPRILPIFSIFVKIFRIPGG
jgi:hypothetical protein